MNDLLQSQIQKSCMLALPEGLKDLMCDISREVLRAQPAHLLQFIADYLSALLVTRENLSIASRVCTDICNCNCHPELKEELRNIGIYDEDLSVVTEVIAKHFNDGRVHESNIMLDILNCTNIKQDDLLELQIAIQNAFIRHQKNHTTIYESSSESEKDEIDNAVQHTLKVYTKTMPTEEEYEVMAQKIQTSYHAYGVKRCYRTKHHEVQEHKSVPERNVTLVEPEASSSKTTVPEVDIYGSHHFQSFPNPHFQLLCMDENESSIFPHRCKCVDHGSTLAIRIYSVSSTSLAGSYMHLPKYKPYSAHDIERLSNLDETPEKEHAHIDYTSNNPHLSIISSEAPLQKEKKISFNIVDEIDEDSAIEDAVKDYEEIEEEMVDTDQNILEDKNIFEELVIIEEDIVVNDIDEVITDDNQE